MAQYPLLGTYPMGRKSSQHGSILVMTLVIMTIALGLASYVVTLSRQSVENSALLLDKLQAKIDTESHLEMAKFLISSGQFHAAKITITPPPDISLDSPDWSLRGDPIIIGRGEIELYDAGSKPSLNKLSPWTLKRLFIINGIDASIAEIATQSYRDWLDTDDFNHLNGAEKNYYRAEKGHGYEPRNNPALQSTEELRLLRGLEGSVASKFVTNLVHLFGTGGLNVNTASLKTLEAVLNISQQQAEDLVALRNQKGTLVFNDLKLLTGRDFSHELSGVSVFSTKSVEIFITTTIGEARDTLRALIDFTPRANAPYVVVSYQQ